MDISGKGCAPLKTPRERIIDAAEKIFGRKGFKAATVREICKTAGVNLAAVNYYFGNKTELYRVVVSGLMERTFKRYPADQGIGPDDPPHKRLKVFIRAVLLRLLAPGGLAGLQDKSRLLAREMADPSPVLDNLIQDNVKPQVALLMDILTPMLGPDTPRERIMRCVFSIIGQCFYYGLAAPIVTRIYPANLTDPAFIDGLCDHIAAFSLGGLEQLCRLQAGEPPAQ
jgi:TetR/AcrR family transcriptional regulator, regulator of cefoperazone and chloramphenicol sensitivity